MAFIFACICDYADSQIPSICKYYLSCTNRWFLTKIKKIIIIKSFTVHLLLFSLIILAIINIFASFYFALFQYFHDILLKYTSNLELAVWMWDMPCHFWWLLFFFLLNTLNFERICFPLFSFFDRCIYFSEHLLCQSRRHGVWKKKIKPRFLKSL